MIHNCKFFVAKMVQKIKAGQLWPQQEISSSKLHYINKYIHFIELVLNKDSLSSSLDVIHSMIGNLDNFSPVVPIPVDANRNTQATVHYLSTTGIHMDEFISSKKNVPNMNIFRMTYRLLFDGLRLRTLMEQAPDRYERDIVQIANEISDFIASNWTVFETCTAVVVQATVLAARVHLEQRDTYSGHEIRIERDLRALKLLEQRFDVISREYGDLVQGLEQWLQVRCGNDREGSISDASCSSLGGGGGGGTGGSGNESGTNNGTAHTQSVEENWSEPTMLSPGSFEIDLTPEISLPSPPSDFLHDIQNETSSFFSELVDDVGLGDFLGLSDEIL